MNKDRGEIKWSSMMLPEHKKLLLEFYEKQNYLKMPNLSDDKLEEINNNLIRAIEEGKTIQLKIHQKNSFQIIEGIIKEYNSFKKELKIINSDRKIVYLILDNIVDII